MKVWMQVIYLAGSQGNTNMGVGSNMGNKGKTLKAWSQQFTNAVNLGSMFLRSLGDSVMRASGAPPTVKPGALSSTATHSWRCHPGVAHRQLRESPRAERGRCSRSPVCTDENWCHAVRWFRTVAASATACRCFNWAQAYVPAQGHTSKPCKTGTGVEASVEDCSQSGTRAWSPWKQGPAQVGCDGEVTLKMQSKVPVLGGLQWWPWAFECFMCEEESQRRPRGMGDGAKQAWFIS